MISKGSGTPSFGDKDNFHKIHPLLFSINKSLYFMNFFVKCYSTPLMACWKKSVFGSKSCCEIAVRWLQITSCSIEGMKWHFTKNLRICCLFYMFRAFRIHIDINIWVKNMLKKLTQTHSKLLKSHSKISEFWCFFVLKISDYSFWN